MCDLPICVQNLTIMAQMLELSSVCHSNIMVDTESTTVGKETKHIVVEKDA
jgi:hypothetical protein